MLSHGALVQGRKLKKSFSMLVTEGREKALEKIV